MQPVGNCELLEMKQMQGLRRTGLVVRGTKPDQEAGSRVSYTKQDLMIMP